jgi:Fe-S cluster assembly protein SufD
MIPASPPWSDLKELAVKRAEEIGLPTQHDEAWRYVNVGPLAKPPVNSPVPVAPATIKPFLIPSCAATFVLVNGMYREDLSQKAEIPGLTVEDLFASKDAAALAERWSAVLKDSGDLTACWSLSDLNGGLRLQARGQTKGVVHILNVASGGSHAGRAVIELAAGAMLDVVISHVEIAASRAIFAAELILGAGSVVRIDELQYGSNSPAHQNHAQHRIRLERDANATWTTLTSGGELARLNSHATLDGQGAQLAIRGLAVLDGKRQAHQYVRVDHRVGHTASVQLFKTIADGESLASFDGSVTIAKGADQANAAQRNNNLLLSAKARVGTRPQLDILDDDVKASHGATVGQLNEDEIFYLRARGLKTDQAVALLSKGFANEVVELMHCAGAKEVARKRILGPFA